MSEELTSKRGMNFAEALFGALLGLGGSFWLLSLALTERPAQGELWDYKWWMYLIYFGLIAAGLLHGLKSLFSISIRFRDIPPEDRLWHEEEAEEKIGTAIVLISLIAGSLAWSFWDSPELVSRRLGIEEEKIVVSPRPHDCEFMTAPVGAKHCSYKAAYQMTTGGWVYQSWRK